MGNSKLTKRKEKESGATYKELSQKYSVSESCVYQIVSNKTWRF